MTAGTLSLPHCQSCHRAHWPPREICPHCLSETVAWQPADNGGRVQTTATLHHSLSPNFRPHLPLQVATVWLDCGVRAVVFLADGPLPAGSRVHVESAAGPTGKEAFVATPGAPR
ncbi:MAG: zinc ribbon domain-containing protein [Proteobacteria bacterium]|nr:zinc ribbon domain-containing protein [Pseudomonadota bacterium]MDA1356919.1 zinc ribbon domain-containing protein [Pseudomonadota bacterium]